MLIYTILALVSFNIILSRAFIIYSSQRTTAADLQEYFLEDAVTAINDETAKMTAEYVAQVNLLQDKYEGIYVRSLVGLRYA